MTLKELGMEYVRQSEVMKARIRALKKSSAGLTPKQLYKVRIRIASLYGDAASLRMIGEHLVSYYGDSDA